MNYSILFIISNILRNLLGLIRVKILAFFWGPAQIGALGQLFTFYNIETKLLNSGTAAALNSLYLKYTADQQKSLITTVIVVNSISTAIITFLTIVFAGTFSELLFNDSSFAEYFYIIAIIGILYSVSYLLETTFQADRNFNILIKGQVFSIITAIIFVVPLTYFYGIKGIIYDLGIWFLTSIIFFSRPYLKFYLPKINFQFLDKKIFIEIIKQSLSDLIRSILFFGSYLVLRIIIIKFMPLEEVGLFQSVFSVTNYVNVIIQGFIVYFFPTISSQISLDDIKIQVQNAFSFIVKIEFLILMVIFIIPEYLLTLLYSAEFSQSGIQLVYLNFGKIFESIYLVGIIVLLGQQKLKAFISIEILRSISLVIMPYLLIDHFGINGFIWGINISMILTSAALILFFKKIQYIDLNKKFVVAISKFIFGTAVFIIIQTLNPLPLILRIGYFGLLFSWLIRFKYKDIKNYFNVKTFFHKDS